MGKTMASNPKVDDHINKLSSPVKAIAERLREIVRDASPDLTEHYKWNMPVYAGTKDVCYIGAFKKHVNLGFYRGAELNDRDNLLEGTGKSLRHVKIASLDDIDKRSLSALIKDAVKVDATDS